MSEWALNAAARFVQQQSMQSQEWARALQKHQILITRAPILWNRLREALQAQMSCFNEHVGKKVLSDFGGSEQKVTIYARTELGQRVMVAKFDPQSCSIAFSTSSTLGDPSYEEKFSMRVGSEDDVIISGVKGGEHGPEEIAGQMLNGLMGWR